MLIGRPSGARAIHSRSRGTLWLQRLSKADRTDPLPLARDIAHFYFPDFESGKSLTVTLPAVTMDIHQMM